MAEGFARAFRGRVIEAFSAGIVAHGKNDCAVRVMAEAGVDISGQESKTLQSLLDRGLAFDWVVTVCGHADEHCPAFAGSTRVIHVGFDDPPKLARDARTDEDALDCYRKVRDEIRAFIMTLPGGLSTGRHAGGDQQ